LTALKLHPDWQRGALSDDLKLMDFVLGDGACTDSNFAHQFALWIICPIADYTL
jgi:purine-nucleoside phosphorylase